MPSAYRRSSPGGAHRQQRDGAAWFTEWLSLPQLCIDAGGMLTLACNLAQRTIPDAASMARELDGGLGLLYSEALTFTLTNRCGLPRPEAIGRPRCMVADDFRIGVFHGDEDIGPAFPDGDRPRQSVPQPRNSAGAGFRSTTSPISLSSGLGLSEARRLARSSRVRSRYPVMQALDGTASLPAPAADPITGR